MNGHPFLMIDFDPLTWTPTAIFSNGRTDEETATIQGIADRMIKAANIQEGGNVHP